jgi:dihydroorotate dehydrogenase
MYKSLRSFLFLFDPEKVHYFSMKMLKIVCSIGLTKTLLQKIFQPKGNLQFTALGLTFPNRVGLAAGFDKNASYLRELDALGFGAVEIGTVTPVAQNGNEKPRVFRLPDDKALINRMGFNNEGVEAVANRLKIWKEKSHAENNTGSSRMIIGGNIGKNKVTPNEEAWSDYEICFTVLQPYVDYFVVNVSSPNTPGLRALQEKESLRQIFEVLQARNKKFAKPKPILLKIAPDLTMEQVDDVIDLAKEIELDGLVVSNTTISREDLSERSRLKKESKEAGGLSGLPVRKRSTELISYIHQKTNGVIPIIASGGIFTAADAQEKLDAGASLVQVWTGFVYEGPGIVKKICKGLHSSFKV